MSLLLRFSAPGLTHCVCRGTGKRSLRSVFCQRAWVRARGTAPNALALSLIVLLDDGARNVGSRTLAHRLLVSISPLLRDTKPSHDLGADVFEKRKVGRIQRQAVAHVEQLGFQASLTSTPEVAETSALSLNA